MTDGLPEGEQIDLLPLVRQRLAWDMLPCDHDYWDVIGVVQPSEDVKVPAHAESHARMNTVARYQPFVDTYSMLCADIITEVMYKNLLSQFGEHEVPEDVTQAWHDMTLTQNREIIRGAVFPILAHMLASGVIEPGERQEMPL